MLLLWVEGDLRLAQRAGLGPLAWLDRAQQTGPDGGGCRGRPGCRARGGLVWRRPPRAGQRRSLQILESGLTRSFSGRPVACPACSSQDNAWSPDSRLRTFPCHSATPCGTDEGCRHWGLHPSSVPHSCVTLGQGGISLSLRLLFCAHGVGQRASPASSGGKGGGEGVCALL